MSGSIKIAAEHEPPLKRHSFVFNCLKLPIMWQMHKKNKSKISFLKIPGPYFSSIVHGKKQQQHIIHFIYSANIFHISLCIRRKRIRMVNEIEKTFLENVIVSDRFLGCQLKPIQISLLRWMIFFSSFFHMRQSIAVGDKEHLRYNPDWTRLSTGLS